MDERDVAIVDAVRRAINDFGIRRFTVADVAAVAGVSRQTVYERFGNRDALVAAALERGARDLVRRSAASAGEIEGPDRLTHAFEAALHFFATSPLWSSPEKRHELLPHVTVGGGVFLGAASQTLVSILRGWYPDARGPLLASSADTAVRTLISHGLTGDHTPREVAGGLGRLLHAALEGHG